VKYFNINKDLRISRTEEKVFLLEQKKTTTAKKTGEKVVKWDNQGYYYHNSLDRIFIKIFFYYLSESLEGKIEDIIEKISFHKNEIINFLSKKENLNIYFGSDKTEKKYLEIGEFRISKRDELNLILEKFKHVKPKQKAGKNGKELKESDKYVFNGYFPLDKISWALKDILKETEAKSSTIEDIKDLIIELSEAQKEISQEVVKLNLAKDIEIC